jgi:hypothetical protein
VSGFAIVTAWAVLASMPRSLLAMQRMIGTRESAVRAAPVLAIIPRQFTGRYKPHMTHEPRPEDTLLRLQLQRLVADAEAVGGLFECEHFLISDLHGGMVRDARASAPHILTD